MGGRRKRAADPEEEAPFGVRLRAFREAAGLTQEELAFRAGLSPNAVSSLERGARRRPYPHTVRSLAEVLGLSDEERARLLAAVPRRTGPAPRADEPAPAHALPPAPTRLVGRERELEDLRHLLAPSDARLLTLTGTGGVGKTRLALEAAREAASLYRDGVAFVELAPLGDPALVLPTVLRSLDLSEGEGRTPREVLVDYLQDKTLLLVLDNFEHLLEAAPGVATLLDACPGLRVLTTSRAPLRVRGEREYAVSPLTLPATTRSPEVDPVLASPSGALFVERAVATSPGFEITPENASAVAAICWRLAGLPLALELAAAKVRFLDPASLLSRLDRALSTAWARDVPERQRTMRATLDWSYDLLADPQRILFRRLSVFAGGFSLEAAEALGGTGSAEAIGDLEVLVEQSLVDAQTGGDAVRYGMLEPVRQYAAKKLEESGETDTVRRLHADFFLDLAENAASQYWTRRQGAWLDKLEREHDNLRAVLGRAHETGDTQAGLTLAGALCWFWWTRGYLEEGRRWVEGFLAADASGDGPPASGPMRARALYGAGQLAFGQGDLPGSVEHFEESLTLYREISDEAGVALVLVELAQVVRAQGDDARAGTLSEEGLALGRESGDPMIAALALCTLGQTARRGGDLVRASANYEQSLELFQKAGDERGMAYAQANLGVVALERGDLALAAKLHGESLALYRRLGDRAGMALSLLGLGDAARELGDVGRAEEIYAEAMALYRELGNERGVARVLKRLPADA